MRALMIAAVVAGCAAPGTYDNRPAPDDPQTVEDALALIESIAGVQIGEGMSDADMREVRRACDVLRLRALAGYDTGTVPWRVWCESLAP